jgi:hypothetical protein
VIIVLPNAVPDLTAAILGGDCVAAGHLLATVTDSLRQIEAHSTATGAPSCLLCAGGWVLDRPERQAG